MSEKTFNAITTEVHGQHLSVRMNGHCLFNLHRPLDQRYQLTLEQDADQYTIWMRQHCNGFSRLYTTRDAGLASNIMDTTADALQRMATVKTRENPGSRYRWLIPGAMFIFLAGAWTSWLINVPHPVKPAAPVPIVQQPALAAEPVAAPLQTRPAAAPLPSESASAATTKTMAQPALRGPLSPEEAAEARSLLATRLKNGAARQEFTIQLSSGHPRTLYVFSDPECPNCHIFEPTVQTLAEQYNVEIFPVTLIGKSRTAEQIVPLLCAPAEKRADMWRRLFDTGAGMLNPGAKSVSKPASCEAGQNALARNDMAFDMYRFPGTPTVISDDGRMIPLQAMSSDTALQAFLNGAQ